MGGTRVTILESDQLDDEAEEEGLTCLRVQGLLRANGTERDPIVIFTSTPLKAERWKGAIEYAKRLGTRREVHEEEEELRNQTETVEKDQYNSGNATNTAPEQGTKQKDDQVKNNLTDNKNQKQNKNNQDKKKTKKNQKNVKKSSNGRDNNNGNNETKPRQESNKKEAP